MKVVKFFVRLKWFFSIVDIVAALTESDYQRARNYWKVLKCRLKDEGNESVTNCNQLKMKSKDGKFYNKERIDETYDPELAINRALWYDKLIDIFTKLFYNI